MKKLASFVLAVAMAAVCAAPAMADNQITESTSGSCDTTVKFDIGTAYMVTIPSEVTLVKNDKNNPITYESDLTLKASNVRLEKGKELHITISNANDYKLTAAGGAELAYTIGGKTPGTEDVVATFNTQAAEQTKTLHIKADDPQFAGEYSGTLTFAIAVADAKTTTKT